MSFPYTFPFFFGGDPGDFRNLSFEEDDGGGFPLYWLSDVVGTACRFAGYDDGTGTASPIEKFEGAWSGNQDFIFAYAQPTDVGQLGVAFYDSDQPDPPGPQSAEDFENGWNNVLLSEFPSSSPASYDSGSPEGVEDFEEEWSSNESFSFIMLSTAPASYDSGAPESVEDFEEEWNANESFSFTMGSTTAASYDAGGTPESVEDFEEVDLPFVVVADAGADKLTKTAHGLSNGQRVSLSNTGGVLPGGLNTGYLYFVVGAAANDFQVAATSGGAAINITDVGVGTHTATPDRTVFWTDGATTI